jgi:hypothetical protein
MPEITPGEVNGDSVAAGEDAPVVGQDAVGASHVPQVLLIPCNVVILLSGAGPASRASAASPSSVTTLCALALAAGITSSRRP